MRKRLEEAAEIHSKCGNNCTTKDILGRKVCKKYCTEYNSFLSGAELGYKEAIAQGKEWLKEHFFYKHHLAEYYWESKCDDMEEALADFEADMTKLWEGEK